MRIGILETGRSGDELVERHGAFCDMFERWLGDGRAHLEFSTYVVHQGEFPPDVRACDAWIITGSPHGVYDRLPWMARLEAFIRRCSEARVPQVGICFGHQIMASAFGGEVAKSERGWGLGSHRMRVVERVPWMSPPLDSVALHVTHQDQVVRPPDGAVVLVSSDFCPASALAYPDRQAISFQGHPEHTTAFARDLIEMKRRHGVEAAVAERAHASLAIPTDESTVGEWVLRFMETTGETTGESNGESNGESGG